MIVYFLEKSKVGVWGAFLACFLIGGYGNFIIFRVSAVESTLQVIKFKTFQIAQKEAISAEDPGETSVGGYQFVASKRGTYYYPKNCSRAKGLSAPNMLYFKDKMTAEAAGYKAHLAC